MQDLMKKVPELSLLIGLSIVGYFVMGAFNQVGEAGALTGGGAFVLVLASFILSIMIAIVAVIAGVGGGVLFTPIMMAFTTMDTLIIRSTGLVVAMFSGLVSWCRPARSCARAWRTSRSSFTAPSPSSPGPCSAPTPPLPCPR